MGTLNPLDIRQIRVRPLTKIAELQPSYATAVPRANVGFLAFHWPAASTISVLSCDGFRMPARSLSLPHAPRPLGRRSKAASERNRGLGAPLSAGAMGIWLARPAQLWCCERGVGSDC